MGKSQPPLCLAQQLIRTEVCPHPPRRRVCCASGRRSGQLSARPLGDAGTQATSNLKLLLLLRHPPLTSPAEEEDEELGRGALPAPGLCRSHVIGQNQASGSPAVSGARRRSLPCAQGRKRALVSSLVQRSRPRHLQAPSTRHRIHQ